MKNRVIRLNIGCGETKLKGFINIDSEKKVKPDLVLNIKKLTLPFKGNTVSGIRCIHNIEHIEQKLWPFILGEFHRVLVEKGTLILAYPEFEVCAEYFISNHRGLRDFWRATLYGRQLYPGDYHVTPMITKEVIQYLQRAGFDNIKYQPEVGEEYNTFLTCIKNGKSLTREDVVRREVFKK